MSLSNKSYEELEKASQEWAEWHQKVIILDEGRKATFSKLFLKYMTKTQEMQNPPQYAKGNLEQIFCLVMVKPYKPTNDNVDGLKPISQAMPTHATQFAPDHAKPVDSMSDMDDEIPF